MPPPVTDPVCAEILPTDAWDVMATKSLECLAKTRAEMDARGKLLDAYRK